MAAEEPSIQVGKLAVEVMSYVYEAPAEEEPRTEQPEGVLQPSGESPESSPAPEEEPSEEEPTEEEPTEETGEPESLRGALCSLLQADRASVPGDHERYVALCLQECTRRQQVLWKGLLAEVGFVAVESPACLPDKSIDAKKRTVIQVFGADNSPPMTLQSTAHPSHTKNTSNKGGMVANLRWPGLQPGLAVGSFHLDGKLEEGKRLSAVKDALGSLPDHTHALFVGDFNFTLDPRAGTHTKTEPLRACLSQATRQMDTLRRVDADDALEQLDPVTRSSLEVLIGEPATRHALYELTDSTPKHISIGQASKELRLHAVHAGQFPTYRVCTQAAGQARWRMLRRDQQMDTDDVHRCFFADNAENKAGRLKKRGEVVRLQCGWNDQLFVGGTCGGSGGDSDLRISAHDPVLVRRADGSVADHALVSWSCVLSGARARAS